MIELDCPINLSPGSVFETTVAGERVCVVGAMSSSLPVVLSARGWATLQQWRLDTLVVRAGRVCATGDGYCGYPHVARLLTGAPKTAVVEHRNGNLLDLRESNLAVVPRSLKRTALQQREQQQHTDQPPLVVLRDGRVRSRRKPPPSTALQRYEAVVRDPHPAATAINGRNL